MTHQFAGVPFERASLDRDQRVDRRRKDTPVLTAFVPLEQVFVPLNGHSRKLGHIHHSPVVEFREIRLERGVPQD